MEVVWTWFSFSKGEPRKNLLPVLSKKTVWLWLVNFGILISWITNPLNNHQVTGRELGETLGNENHPMWRLQMLCGPDVIFSFQNGSIEIHDEKLDIKSCSRLLIMAPRCFWCLANEFYSPQKYQLHCALSFQRPGEKAIDVDGQPIQSEPSVGVHCLAVRS